MFSSFIKRKSSADTEPTPPPESDEAGSRSTSTPLSPPEPTRSSSQAEHPIGQEKQKASPLGSDATMKSTTVTTDDTQLTDTVPTTDSFEVIAANANQHTITFLESTGAETYEDEELEYSVSSKLNKDRYIGSLSLDQKFERLMELVEELHVNSVQNSMIQEDMVTQMEQRVAAKLATVKADVLTKLEEAKQLALLDDDDDDHGKNDEERL